MSAITVKDDATVYYSRRVNVRPLTAAREVRSMQESSTRVTEDPATLDVREVQPNRAASFFAEDFGLDAVAGSEFVDDRIRLRE